MKKAIRGTESEKMHDLRNQLTVMKLGLGLFDLKDIPVVSRKKVINLFKLLNTVITKIEKILKR